MYYAVREATFVLCIILPIFAIIAVCLRFAARMARKLPLWADDWVILCSLITTVPACILTAVGVASKGLGDGPIELAHYDVREVFKMFYAIMLLLYLTQGTTKISVTLFYKRIFTTPAFKLAANIMLGVIGSWTVALFTCEALNSWNIPGFWNERLVNYSAFNLTMASLDFVLDVSVLLLPLPLIKGLQIDNKSKYSIIGIFALGSIAVIASVCRIYYTHEFIRIGPESSETWVTYLSTSNSLWLAIEACVSIIAACLPTLGAFIKARKATQKSEATPMAYITADIPKSGGKWVQLKDMGSTTTSTTVNGMDERKDTFLRYPERILVERTFESTNEMEDIQE